MCFVFQYFSLKRNKFIVILWRSSRKTLNSCSQEFVDIISSPSTYWGTRDLPAHFYRIWEELGKSTSQHRDKGLLQCCSTKGRFCKSSTLLLWNTRRIRCENVLSQSLNRESGKLWQYQSRFGAILFRLTRSIQFIP